MSKNFFPPRPELGPTIYAYEDTNPQYSGLFKIGYTTINAKTRVAQQYPIVKPGKPPYRIVLEEVAMRNDGTLAALAEECRLEALTDGATVLGIEEHLREVGNYD